VFSTPHVRHLAENVARGVFGDLLGELEFGLSESVGYTHTLHKFRILVERSKYVGVRVVVKDKKAIRVPFTITGVSTIDLLQLHWPPCWHDFLHKYLRKISREINCHG